MYIINFFKELSLSLKSQERKCKRRKEKNCENLITDLIVGSVANANMIGDSILRGETASRIISVLKSGILTRYKEE